MSKREPVRLTQSTGTRRGPLHVPSELKEPGYFYRWVNATGYKIEEKKEEGYQFTPLKGKEELVKHIGDASLREGSARDGSYVCRIVGTQENGEGMKAYLMRIPLELYKARRVAHDKTVDEIEEALGQKTGSDHEMVTKSFERK